MFKGRKQSILMLVAVAVLIFLLFNLNSKSSYTITEREYAPFGAGPVAPGPSAVRTSLILVSKLVSPKPLVAVSVTPISRFVRTLPTPKLLSFGTIPLSCPISCSVVCVLKD